MPFTGIFCKSASTLAPLARRIVQGAGYQSYQSAVFAAVNHRANLFQRTPSVVVLFQRHYRAADRKKRSSPDSLLEVIETEIKVAEETDDHARVEEIPEDFPFKIEDNAGQQTLVLTRIYEGEPVKVEVHMPDLVTGEHNFMGGRNDDDDDSRRPTQSSLPIVVTVSKKSGTCLEFSCVAYPEEIAIDSLSIKTPENASSEEQVAYEGPEFQDLDENLQLAFKKYLEIRGISPSTTNHLHEYMINKDSREYLRWLKNVKSFIEA